MKRREYNYSTARTFDALHSFISDGVLCDVELTADGGAGIVYAHKAVLASASQYFLAMFTNGFEESFKKRICIKSIGFDTLRLLVDFMYSGKILVSEYSVQDLLLAADILQLHDVKDACCQFLENLMQPTNCYRINALADLYSCMDLLSLSESYTRQHFAEVVESDEFVSLSFNEVVKLISNNELTVSSEDKVLESVIRWVNHNHSSSRENILPKLMEHVRLPLLSKESLLKKVIEEPFFNNSPECKDFIIEALCFHLSMSELPRNISKTERTIPRKRVGFSEVILVAGGIRDRLDRPTNSIEWYDPATNKWQFGPEMNRGIYSLGLAVFNDQYVYAVGGLNGSVRLNTVQLLDLSSPSPSWVPTVPMLARRAYLGVTILNNILYAVGGCDDTGHSISSAEVFDINTQEWRWISSMNVTRSGFSLGIIDNLIYAVGGYNSKLYDLNSVECYHPCYDWGLGTINMLDLSTPSPHWVPLSDMLSTRAYPGVAILDNCIYVVGGSVGISVQSLRSVECYHPCNDTWHPVASMNQLRYGASVGVLDGILYVAGGSSSRGHLQGLRSVEAYHPSTGVWTYVADMNFGRIFAGAVAIDGLLYVVGGLNHINHLESVEVYNPITNTWTLLTTSMNIARRLAGVAVIGKPPHIP